MGSLPQNKYLPALTGLRALLAWDVFLFHYSIATPGNMFLNLFANGGGDTGVLLFFVLSGFLITYHYSSRPYSDRREIFTYLFRRWTRIYPLYFVVSILSVGLLTCMSGRHELNCTNVLLHLTLLKGFFQKRVYLFIGPAWSLTVEECFYILAPFLFLIRTKAGLLLGCIFLFITGLFITWCARAGGSNDFMYSYSFMISRTIFGLFFPFCAGAWLAFLSLKNNMQESSKPFFTLLGGAAIIVAQAGLTLLRNKPVNAPSYTVLLNAAANVVLPLLGLLLIYGLLTERSPLRALLETPLFGLLGKSSFAFYLLHHSPLVWMPARYLGLSNPVIFLGTVMLSIGFYLGLEHPLHASLNRWWKNKKQPLPAIQLPSKD